MCKGHAQLWMIAHSLVKAWPTKATRSSVDENTAMKKDREVQPRCNFINPMRTVVIRVPTGGYELQSSDSRERSRLFEIIWCVGMQRIHDGHSKETVTMASYQSR